MILSPFVLFYKYNSRKSSSGWVDAVSTQPELCPQWVRLEKVQANVITRLLDTATEKYNVAVQE
jgi:hypothetical protein